MSDSESSVFAHVSTVNVFVSSSFDPLEASLALVDSASVCVFDVVLKLGVTSKLFATCACA